MPKVAVVDFDSTISANRFPEVGPPVPGAISHLRRLKSRGYQIVVSSCRNNPTMGSRTDRQDALRRMGAFLRQYSVPHDRIDDGKSGKMFGSVYIDDKAAGCPLRRFRGMDVVDWPKVYRMIMAKERVGG